MKNLFKKFFHQCLIAVLSFSLANAAEKVDLSCSEQDAKIFVDGMLVGNGTAKIAVNKGECVNVKVTKVGFVTIEKNYCNKKGTSLPDKDFIKMEQDDAFTSSMSTDIANVDIIVKATETNLETWKVLNSIVLSYFDVIELTDKETSYLRTAWSAQTFKTGMVRTRFIVKSDPGGYRVKLVSEFTSSVSASVKSDELFKEWDRVLRKYSGIISDLQARIK